MKNRKLEKVLHIVLTLVAAFIIAAVGICAINSALENGGDKCYVNGEVVFSK